MVRSLGGRIFGLLRRLPTPLKEAEEGETAATLIRNERIVQPFRADRAHRPMPAEERDVVAERQQFCLDRVDQLRVAAER